ncbi:class II histocompatibility antigen, M beta 1 chain-like isoform X2 [Myripristis murdjan]|uniref:class II histocompatibility antigen, M beta 1 chain-like isoform X2 n=1 Tax=Myripristis murdjan TaxID=586833 RepID=UPI001176327A|nr:class II histocompatibility antigen, M beta 1 chain-like isoform X2 [Myripristis murdjan]
MNAVLCLLLLFPALTATGKNLGLNGLTLAQRKLPAHPPSDRRTHRSHWLIGVSASLNMDAVLCLLLLFPALTATALSADGKYYHIMSTCQFIEKASQYDVQYKIQYHFNGRLLALYNSSTEKVLGFTEYGKRLASNLNKDVHYLQRRRTDLNVHCKEQAAELYKHMQGQAVPPVASLRRDRPEVAGGPVVLICSAYDFYPRQIKVSWLRDGVVVPEMEVMEKLVSVSWRYQIHSYLKEPAGEGLNIQCMVKHQSLPEPMLLRLGTRGL